jgi:hypothetical protein
MTTGPRLVSTRRALLAVGCTAALAALLIAFDFTGQASGAVTGPDVTVFSFGTTGISSYGSANGFAAFSIPTTSCNRGDTPVNWCRQNGGSGCAPGSTITDHPVISQNLYRLKNGRFDQIGMSWVKHGFLSLNQSSSGCSGATGQSCTSPPAGGNQLGVGCTDPYSASLNGTRPLDARSDVNATTGAISYPYTTFSSPNLYDQRIKVATTDLDAATNVGALYFVEGQYIARDDASAGNAFNNASHQRVSVGASPSYAMSLVSGSFIGQLPAIYAWRAQDPTVSIVNADVPGAIAERYQVARKVTDLGDGHWHYELAVHNMNSDRAARTFTVEFPGSTGFTNVGFKGIAHHSGEPYATDDWVPSTTANSITWSTDSFATNPNAHALRWATMFNFWFDSDQPPGNSTLQTIGLFRPGDPASIDVSIVDLLGDSFESGDLTQWSSAAGAARPGG